MLHAEAAASKRIGDIEVLRAYAVLLTVAAHVIDLLPITLWSSYSHLVRGIGCWQGVDLFLVISGFVITRLLLGGAGTGAVPGVSVAMLKRFWIRRIWRLWPAAWLWLVIVLVSCLIPSLGVAFGGLGANVRAAAAGVLFYANLRMADAVMLGYYYGGTPQYWSLSLEEQFYLLLPLAMLVAGRLLPAMLLVGIVVQLPLAHGPYFTLFRTDALMWGVLIACFEHVEFVDRVDRMVLRKMPVLRRLLVIGLLVMLPAIGVGSMIHPPFELGGIAIVAAILVRLAAYDANYITEMLPFSRALHVIGRRSYALYLVHIPTFVFAAYVSRQLPQATSAPLIWQAFTATMMAVVLLPLLTELTHRLVEEPGRRLGRRLTAH